jgi:nicotinamidase-related amidase
MMPTLGLQPERAMVLVVDVQEKLLPKILDSGDLLENLRFFLHVCHVLNIPRLVTEQYPNGLGFTASLLMPYLLGESHAKLCFSSWRVPAIAEALQKSACSHVVVVGMETPICILQTVQDLLTEGYRVVLPVDALGARRKLDHDVALQQMQHDGAILTTVESLAYTWLADAKHRHFKSISKLVVERD